MSGVCPAPNVDAGVVKSVLSAVDCNVRYYSQAGYFALTGPDSVFPTALTLLLTLYVAIVGYHLLLGLGGARLADAPMMAVKIGFILALTLNWTAFQTLVFDVAIKAPVELARIVARPAAASAATLSSDPVKGLQLAYDQIVLDATAFGKAAGPNPQVLSGGAAAAADGLWKAAAMLFMSTAGFLAISTIAVGVLVAIGPIFIALFLFEATRGLFVGWLRAVLAAALAPMVCWITTSIMLVVLQPWLTDLAHGRDLGQPDVNLATAVISLVFVFAAAQGALVIGGAVIAGGFKLPAPRALAGGTASRTATEVQTIVSQSRAEQIASAVQRSAYMASLSTRQTTSSTSAGVGVSGQGVGPDRLGATYRRDAFADRVGQSRERST